MPGPSSSLHNLHPSPQGERVPQCHTIAPFHPVMTSRGILRGNIVSVRWEGRARYRIIRRERTALVSGSRGRDSSDLPNPRDRRYTYYTVNEKGPSCSKGV